MCVGVSPFDEAPEQEASLVGGTELDSIPADFG